MNSLFCAFTLVTLFALNSGAFQKNPQIRTCNQMEGIYFEAKSDVDLFGFCAFDDSVIGTLDLIRHFNDTADVAAIRTYLNNIKNCEPFGHLVTLTTVEGKTTLFCAFADNSMLDYKTLTTGIYDKRNAKFNLALGVLE